MVVYDGALFEISNNKRAHKITQEKGGKK